MGASEWVAIGLATITGIFGLLGWSLNRQIAQHEKENDEKFADVKESTDLLFKKHDEDAAKLQDLREMVLSQHYKREELDIKFERLEGAFSHGLEGVAEKLDELNKTMTTHIGEHAGVQRSGVVR